MDARTLARRLHVERPLKALRRPFLPAHVRADMRDNRLLHELLDELLEPDSDCVDIGANRGVVLTEMLARAPHGRHVAFEPLPELARELRTTFPRVDVHQAALSDRPGTREFVRVVDDPGWSGFRERPVPGATRTERIEVAVEVLDDALPADARPVLVKIDVEGAELEVLEGARRTLAEHRPVVVFEHGVGSADYYGTEPEHVHELLTGLGYEISGLDGDGPYDRAAFGAVFRAGARVNFAARPAAG